MDLENFGVEEDSAPDLFNSENDRRSVEQSRFIIRRK